MTAIRIGASEGLSVPKPLHGQAENDIQNHTPRPRRSMSTDSPANLDEAPLLAKLRVSSLDGPRDFRRRLMELGLLPGTDLRKLKVAPMGDPIELELRGTRLSIRREQAKEIHVELLDAP